MISENDWSKLITVNFEGGMGGDFFSLLLNENFSPTLYIHNSRYKFNYTYCPFNCVLREIRLLNSAIEIVYPNYIENLKQQGKFIKRPLMWDWLANEKNTFYDRTLLKYVDFVKGNLSDGDNLIQDVTNFFFDNYKNNFINTKISTFHNTNYPLFTLGEIFPKSHNIFYHTENSVFQKLICVLVLYKGSLDSFLDYFIESIESEPTYFEPNEFFIDAFELIFKDKSYDKQISDFLGTNITLNKDQIKKYKNYHIQLFDQWGINIYKDHYSTDVLIDKLRLVSKKCWKKTGQI